jgi:hypothetical protein
MNQSTKDPTMNRRELLSGLIACLPARALLADNWPQFRGPGARGIANDDPRLLSAWNNKENILWRRDFNISALLASSAPSAYSASKIHKSANKWN